VVDCRRDRGSLRGENVRETLSFPELASLNEQGSEVRRLTEQGVVRGGGIIHGAKEEVASRRTCVLSSELLESLLLGEKR